MRVNYAQAVYGEEEIAAVVEVLEHSTELLMAGPRVSAFEAAVAGRFGKEFGVMVNSGSSANLVAIEGLGLEHGSEVVTPALTFSTTVAPLIQSGLTPVFVDVEPDTYTVDVAHISERITSRTRALMIPNLIGNLPDWKAVRALADTYGLVVIEDSCDTIGSTIAGMPTGALTDVATTSFYASHIITAAGFGGMMTTSNPDLAQRARLLRGWGRTSSTRAESEGITDRFDVAVDGIDYDAKFMFEALGYNFLPSELSAAFGLVQLGRLDEYARRRSTNFAKLRQAFSGYEDWFILPRQGAEIETAWLAFPLIVRDSAPFTRRELQIGFETDGIQTRVVFTGNVLRQPAFSELNDAGSGSFPNADRVMRGGVLLGCHQGMGDDEIAYIMDSFARFASAY